MAENEPQVKYFKMSRIMVLNKNLSTLNLKPCYMVNFQLMILVLHLHKKEHSLLYEQKMTTEPTRH